MSLKAFLLITVVLFGIGATYFYVSKNNQDETPPKPQSTKTVEPTTEFDKQQYSLNNPSSQWVIVNKLNAIPLDYKPALTVPDVKLRLAPSEQQMQISQTIANNIKKMFATAADDGVTLVFGSGYRSAELQKQFYDSYVAQDGQAAADTYSARPGHSEHQTGLAVDITSQNGICHLEICWENTPEGKWVQKNAHKYGFIIRYPDGKEKITGYQYEPWHLRYVGKELATELHKNNQTLEEFFGFPPATEYN